MRRQPRQLRRQQQRQAQLRRFGVTQRLLPNQLTRQFGSIIRTVQRYVDDYLNQTRIQMTQGLGGRQGRTQSLANLIRTGFKGYNLPNPRARFRQALYRINQPQTFMPVIRQANRWLSPRFTTLNGVQSYINRILQQLQVPLQNLRSGIGTPRIYFGRINQQQRDQILYQIILPQDVRERQLNTQQFLLSLIASQVYLHVHRAILVPQIQVQNWRRILNMIFYTDNFQYFLQRAQIPQAYRNIQIWYQIYETQRRQQLHILSRYLLPDFWWLYKTGNRRHPYDSHIVSIQQSKFNLFQGVPQSAYYSAANLRNEIPIQIQNFQIQIQNQRQIISQIQPAIPIITQVLFPFQRAFRYGIILVLYRLTQLSRFLFYQRDSQILDQNSIIMSQGWLASRYANFTLQLVCRFQSGWARISVSQQFDKLDTLTQLFENLDVIFDYSLTASRILYQKVQKKVSQKQNHYLAQSQNFQLQSMIFGTQNLYNLWHTRPYQQQQIYDLTKAVFFPGRAQQRIRWWTFDPQQKIDQKIAKQQYKTFSTWKSSNQTKQMIISQVGVDQSKLCWVLVTYFACLASQDNSFQIPLILDFFRGGYFWLAIQQLVKVTGWSFYNNIQPQRNIQRQTPYVFYLSGRHLTIYKRQQLKKTLHSIPNQKQTMNTTRITTIRQNKQDRHYATIQSNIKSWQQHKPFKNVYRGITVQPFPMQNTVDRIFFNNCLFVDIQCLSVVQSVQTCYLACMTGCTRGYASQNQWVYYDIQGFQAANQLISQIKIITDTGRYTAQDPLTIWFFNGIKYQMSYFYKPLQNLYGSIKCLGQPGQARGFTLKQGSIIFRDGRSILPPGSLKQLTKLYAKSQTDLKQQFDIVKIKQPQHVIQHIQKITTYCLQDCNSLAKVIRNHYCVLQTFNQQISQQTQRQKIPISTIMRKLTTPSVANLFMFYYYLQRPILDNQPQQIKQKQRQGYYGGITQVFKHVVQNIIQSYDLNSSYPASMIQRMPWHYQGILQIDLAKRIYQTRQDWHLLNDLDFIQISAFDHKKLFPWIPYKHDTGLIYANSANSGKYYIWGKQLRQLPQTQVRVQNVWRYSNVYRDRQNIGTQIWMTRTYTQFFYNLKRQYKRSGNKAYQSVAKLFLNSAYGKLGQRKFYQHTLVHQDWQFLPQSMHKVSFTKWGNLYSQLPKGTTSVGDFVRVASYITASSRAKLASAGNKVGIQNIYYCDTDSLYVKGGTFIRQLLSQYQLGLWKHQATFQKAIFIAPKCSIAVQNKQCSKKICDHKQNQLCNRQISQSQRKCLLPYYDWTYKWKGIPIKMLKRLEGQRIWNSFKISIMQLAYGYQGQLLPYQSYPVGQAICSQRWVKVYNGIMIQHYWRKTSLFIKKWINQDTTLKPFDL